MPVKSSNTEVCTFPLKKKYILTHEEYHRDIEILAGMLVGQKFTGIAPIVRGGLGIALRLSHLLGIHGFAFRAEQIKGGRWLIIDDVSDTGKTLVKYTSQIEKGEFVVATLYRKDHTVFEPNYYVRTINNWIVFPYEKTS